MPLTSGTVRGVHDSVPPGRFFISCLVLHVRPSILAAMRLPSLLLLTFVAIGCAGSPPKPTPAPSPIARAPVPDANGLHLYRNYFAIERVGPAASHFTAWWTDVEPSHCDATVEGSSVVLSGCMFGGLSVAPKEIPPVPEAHVEEKNRVEAAVRAKNPNASGLKIGFRGRYRELVVSELIVVTGARMMGKPVGWHARAVLRADDALTRVDGLGAGMSQSSYGMIDVPNDAARVRFTLPAEGDGQRLVLGHAIQEQGGPLEAVPHVRELLERVLATARELDARPPASTMGDLFDSPLVATLHESYDQPVYLGVQIYARHANFAEQRQRTLVVPLHPRQAATEGSTTRSAEAEIDGMRVKLTATMTRLEPAKAPLPKTPLEMEGEDMEATVTVRLEDDRGNRVERSFPARGKVVGKAPVLATPAGLVMPGGQSPSKEADALRATWPGNGRATSFDLYIQPDLVASPIEPR